MKAYLLVMVCVCAPALVLWGLTKIGKRVAL